MDVFPQANVYVEFTYLAQVTKLVIQDLLCLS